MTVYPRSASWLCVASTFFGGTAFAQDSPAPQLEEIIVTAERREESLQKVPLSITAFTEEMLNDTNVRDLRGYFVQVPNVTFQESARSGPRSVDIAIRGVSNIGGGVNAFGVYLDGLNIANIAQEGSVNPALNDVERIEVLRGPQGTFFGRNATGGAINISTNRPESELTGQISGHFGRYNTWGMTGIVNVPVVEETLFLRAMLNHEGSDGFVKNVNLSGGRSDYELTSAKLAGSWIITDNLTAYLASYITRETSGLDPLVPTGVLDADTASIVGTTVPVSDGLPFYPENTTLVNHDRREIQHNDMNIHILHLTYDTDGYQIKSITGYIDTKRDYQDDLDFTSESLVYQDVLDTASSWSEEVRVQSMTEGPIRWTFGGIYAQDRYDDDYGVRAGTDGFFGLPFGFPIDVGDNSNKITSWALFGQATWYIDESLYVTAGGRYTHDKVEGTSDGIGFGTPNVLETAETSFTDVSPRLSLSYDWNDDVTTYVTVSKGYKAGGLQFNDFVESRSFDEEILWNYEAGIRSYLFDRMVRLNATVFYMDWTDLQVSSFATFTDQDTGEIQLVSVTSNAASASSRGIELGFAAQPTAQWYLAGSVGYLDATFDEFPDANITGVQVDLSGEDMIRAPDWTLNLQTQYNFPVDFIDLANTEGYVRAEWSYRSEAIPNIEAIIFSGFPNVTPTFDVANLRLGISSDEFGAEIFVENALDEEYFTGQSNFGFGGIRVRPHPRTWGVRFSTYFQ